MIATWNKYNNDNNNDNNYLIKLHNLTRRTYPQIYFSEIPCISQDVGLQSLKFEAGIVYLQHLPTPVTLLQCLI